ncbi:hypothetical protein SAMN05421833_14152 [Microbispora rosea]|uniref:Uncharacterized protein n=1 Tax=Microbispora rosea TaxID=58117 RepID=A0A1N7HAP1_9ACTN|nr:hypothetical protein [Microbispora rosea]GIH52329.1 hypothetical protein Mro03_75080 [Microbispora rosea subsp. rosea]SIS21892.1 hypothetical protein SAMN05421833_14152 [Microbispora rosea]
MSISTVEAASPVANDVSHASDLRAAARWLVGASASIVAVLVAGLQLRSLKGLLDVGPWAVVLALLAILAALLSVVWTLYGAAAVLAAPRRSIGELSDLDRADHGNYPDPRLESPSSPLMKYLVVERRTDLLGAGRDAISQLIQDHTKAYNAIISHGPNTQVQIGAYTYKLDDLADRASLADVAADLDRRIKSVIDAASAFESWRRYTKLASGLKKAGIVFVTSLLLLVGLTALPPHLVDVKAPIPVQVAIPKSWSGGCGGRMLDGVAVGGTLNAPIVVLPAQGGCAAQKIENTEDLIVIPRPVK